jgi:hypothetical protein
MNPKTTESQIIIDIYFDEKMVFVGEIGTDDKSLTGKIEPVDVPTNYSCSLAYADTKGTKRENRRSQD